MIAALLLALTGCSGLKADDSARPDGTIDYADDAGSDAMSDVDDVAYEGDAPPDRSLEGGTDASDVALEMASDRSETADNTGGADDTSTDARGADALEDIGSEAGPVDDAPVCVPDCPTLGDFRCGAIGDGGPVRQIQICSLAQGCLKWMNSANCAPSEMCCEGACRSVGSPSACAPEFDYYVDAALGADDIDGAAAGTRGRPFRTVSRAVREATTAARSGRRIYVGPGVYDVALGETFPLVLRNGLSLYGAGAGLVTILGTGDYSSPIGGGVVGFVEKATIVAGDITEKTTIADITVRAVSDVATLYNVGVYCDRGSAPTTAATVGVTSIEDAVIGPGYDSAVTAYSSVAPAPSGCNLRMLGSRVTGAFNGVTANGCRSGASQPRQVAVQIGTAERGNLFTSMSSQNSDSAGLFLQECVANGYIFNNSFQDSPEGIRIAQQSDPLHGIATHPFIINGNTFTRLSHVGLSVFGDAPVVDMNDNSFVHNNSPANATYGAAIALWAHGNSEPYNASGMRMPIRKARRNTFYANDVGLLLTSTGVVMFSEAGPLDFGTLNDPGGNVFRCNSSESHDGADVEININTSTPISFAGNVWDHFPPAQDADGVFLDGTDYVVDWRQTPINTEGGRSEWAPCPTHHVPGPTPVIPDSGAD